MNKTNLSPCISNCHLDDADICLGCFRSLTEIMDWQDKSTVEQAAILVHCQQRKKSIKN
jgi:uncharacterized protein